MLSSLLATILFAVTSPGQTLVVASPAEPGMYVEVSGGLTKVIGQIVEFKRSGSLFVSDITIGIKTRKENIQLLGAHAQSVVSAQLTGLSVPHCNSLCYLLTFHAIRDILGIEGKMNEHFLNTRTRTDGRRQGEERTLRLRLGGNPRGSTVTGGTRGAETAETGVRAPED